MSWHYGNAASKIQTIRTFIGQRFLFFRHIKVVIGRHFNEKKIPNRHSDPVVTLALEVQGLCLCVTCKTEKYGQR